MNIFMNMSISVSPRQLYGIIKTILAVHLFHWCAFL